MHVIAAKAVCFKEALSKNFKPYTKQVIQNANLYLINSYKIILKSFLVEQTHI